MMSEQQNTDNNDTLFSFELLVENVRIEKQSHVCGELAFAVRLLDFPTLLIYQPPQRNGEDQEGEHTFNRGKSCFFKMNLSSLHSQLTHTPLYAMVLDVKEEIPKLVGSSLIPMAQVMDRIRQDVAEHGASSPSSHGERVLVGMCSLTGERVGSISLSYKLLSLGASLLPHITEGTGTQGGQESTGTERNTSTGLLPLDTGDTKTAELTKCNTSRTNQNNKACNEHSLILEETPPEDELSSFCPPHLFYRNTAEDENTNEGADCTFLNLDTEVFTFEDTSSEEDLARDKIDGTRINMDQQLGQDLRTSQNQRAQTLNVLSETLQQLPLLNALLVELSQLNGQSQHQPLAIHPNLAWIYRSVSTEPPPGHRATHRQEATKSMQKTKQLKHIHSPRHCSTPVVRPASVKENIKQDAALMESKSTSKAKNKLVYGTTKTFNLRLKQVSPLKLKQRECVEMLQSERQSSAAKGKKKSCKKSMKSRQSGSKQSSSLNENIETMMQSIAIDSAQQGTITLRKKNLHGTDQGKQDRLPPRISEKPSPSERDFKSIHIPGAGSDSVAQNKGRSEHHCESNQSQSDCDRRREEIESSGRSRHSSPKSVSSAEGGEVEDYDDDFNSLEPSDGYSPEPLSSPEPSRAKTPKSPVRPDSESEYLKGRVVLPVTTKAPSSPQRSLRGTHLIQPRTQASVLSFSSDDDDRVETGSSVRTVCSRKPWAEGSGVERSSGAESFMSSRGQRSESSRNSPVQGLSESMSSLEPQEAEELEDELGSLDFRKEYQHISQLVANKLPGYTM